MTTSAGRPAESDADAKLARAARSAQRLAQLSRAPYGAPTLDLFAEDAERATLQALNTDIRQTSLPGFELPEVFMAAVPADDSVPASARPLRGGALSSVAALRDDAAAMQTDNQTADAATLDLMFDDVVATQTHGVVAGPVQPEPLDDGMQGATAMAVSGEGRGQGSGKRASAARARGAARNVSMTGPSPVAFAPEVETAAEKGEPGAASTTSDAPVTSVTPAPKPATPPSATLRETARAAANPHREPPQSLAAALIGDDRRTRPSASNTPQAASREASELDTARATTYADTIDALYAVIADQRGAAAVLSRRVKTVLMIVICVLLVTVAAGVAQTIALTRLARENTVQQQRIEQLMLTQQATLASFFDTDSATIAIPNRGNTSTSAVNRNPDPAPQSRAAKRAQSKPH
ncbi:hypothetical protein ABH944_005271 [Caballeronia udeis]|uniref:Cell wall surface anchor family protein n=1 Tax=Caballeronia udeis TaxID=1232866 RepID=A0ABW8MQF1_9BURK